MSSCPHTRTDRRKTWYPGENREHGVELVDGVWQVRSMAAAREVLRARTTTQAGFNAEMLTMGKLRPPILFNDGTVHREQRAKIARYFAPKTVDSRYMTLMEGYADELVAEVRRERSVDLAQLAMRYSVRVAAEVVGLTESDMDKMARRMEKFFSLPLVPADGVQGPRTLRSRFDMVAMSVRGQIPMWGFHLADVRPAIKARKARRQEDVISFLLDEGYTDTEIMIECVTYGAAGMVTTREFISMVTWHLLEDDALRERYLAADKPERYQILWEVLRVEPIVGHLLRRTHEPIEVPTEEGTVTIPAGALVDVHIRNSNDDPAVVGEDPTNICPGRPLPPRVGEEVMSFGDGSHKCPGNSLAIQETDVLLTRLLRLPIRLASTPAIGWDELIKGFEVRNVRLELTA